MGLQQNFEYAILNIKKALDKKLEKSEAAKKFNQKADKNELNYKLNISDVITEVVNSGDEAPENGATLWNKPTLPDGLTFGDLQLGNGIKLREYDPDDDKKSVWENYIVVQQNEKEGTTYLLRSKCPRYDYFNFNEIITSYDYNSSNIDNVCNTTLRYLQQYGVTQCLKNTTISSPRIVADGSEYELLPQSLERNIFIPSQEEFTSVWKDAIEEYTGISVYDSVRIFMGLAAPEWDDCVVFRDPYSGGNYYGLQKIDADGYSGSLGHMDSTYYILEVLSLDSSKEIANYDNYFQLAGNCYDYSTYCKTEDDFWVKVDKNAKRVYNVDHLPNKIADIDQNGQYVTPYGIYNFDSNTYNKQEIAAITETSPITTIGILNPYFKDQFGALTNQRFYQDPDDEKYYFVGLNQTFLKEINGQTCRILSVPFKSLNIIDASNVGQETRLEITEENFNYLKSLYNVKQYTSGSYAGQYTFDMENWSSLACKTKDYKFINSSSSYYPFYVILVEPTSDARQAFKKIPETAKDLSYTPYQYDYNDNDSVGTLYQQIGKMTGDINSLKNAIALETATIPLGDWKPDTFYYNLNYITVGTYGSGADIELNDMLFKPEDFLLFKLRSSATNPNDEQIIFWGGATNGNSGSYTVKIHASSAPTADMFLYVIKLEGIKIDTTIPNICI